MAGGEWNELWSSLQPKPLCGFCGEVTEVSWLVTQQSPPGALRETLLTTQRCFCLSSNGFFSKLQTLSNHTETEKNVIIIRTFRIHHWIINHSKALGSQWAEGSYNSLSLPLCATYNKNAGEFLSLLAFWASHLLTARWSFSWKKDQPSLQAHPSNPGLWLCLQSPLTTLPFTLEIGKLS